MGLLSGRQAVLAAEGVSGTLQVLGADRQVCLPGGVERHLLRQDLQQGWPQLALTAQRPQEPSKGQVDFSCSGDADHFQIVLHAFLRAATGVVTEFSERGPVSVSLRLMENLKSTEIFSHSLEHMEYSSRDSIVHEIALEVDNLIFTFANRHCDFVAVDDVRSSNRLR